MDIECLPSPGDRVRKFDGITRGYPSIDSGRFCGGPEDHQRNWTGLPGHAKSWGSSPFCNTLFGMVVGAVFVRESSMKKATFDPDEVRRWAGSPEGKAALKRICQESSQKALELERSQRVEPERLMRQITR